jgi:hypothetical protein
MSFWIYNITLLCHTLTVYFVRYAGGINKRSRISLFGMLQPLWHAAARHTEMLDFSVDGEYAIIEAQH